MLLEKIRELVQKTATIVAGYLQAPGGLERLFRSLDRDVDVLGRRGRDLGEHFASDCKTNSIRSIPEESLCGAPGLKTL